MDFLNTAAAQLRDLFRSMTPGARITSVLLLLVVAISVVYLFKHQVSGPDAYLMGGEPFSASQLPAMEAAFSQASLTDYRIEGNRIRVPQGKSADYMGALADAGALPPNFGSYLNKALEDGSVFLSPKDKQMRLQIAKQNELGLILRSMPGIENASVLYERKKGTGLNRTEIVTATVSIKPLGNEPIERKRIPMIRNLVAGSIAGLRRQNVTVADLNGRTYGGSGEEGDGGDPEDDIYYGLKQRFEIQLKEKLADSLAYVPGVIVNVSADLDPELKHVEEKVQVDPKAVVLKSRTETDTNLTENEAPSGRPGVAAQGPLGGPTNVARGRKTKTESEKTNEETVSTTSTDKLLVERKGFTPKRVRVTVTVPSAYFLQVWHENNKPAEGEEKREPDKKELDEIEASVRTNIERTAVALLPKLDATEDPYPQVTVTTFQSLQGESLPIPSTTDNALAWIGHYWSTISMMGLALFSLMMLRSMIKSVPAPDPVAAGASAPLPSLNLITEQDEENPEQEPRKKLKRKNQSGSSLKEDLSEMVREDPDVAAAILKNWINNAG